jgi:hypothetical protein
LPWSPSTGTGGRHPPETVVAFNRKPWSPWTGALMLLSYVSYYNGTRTHLSLNKDAPMSRAAETAGRILCHPILGGLHHQYVRI